MPLHIAAGLRRTIVALPSQRCVRVVVHYDVNPFAVRLGALLSGHGLVFSDAVVFGRLYPRSAATVIPPAPRPGPVLDIRFTSQGGSLYVRDYPDSVDPTLHPDWPGYQVHVEPRPDVRGTPKKAAEGLLRHWRARLAVQEADARVVNALLPGPCDPPPVLTPAPRRAVPAACRAPCDAAAGQARGSPGQEEAVSVVEPLTPPIAAGGDRRRLATAAGGAAMLAGLALVLAGGIPSAVAVAVGVVGVLITVALVVPAGVRVLARHPSLLLVAGLLGLAAVWLDAGLRRASELPDGLSGYGPSGTPYPFALGGYLDPRIISRGGWPWQIGHLSLLPLVVTVLAAAGGLVLVADAARLRLGITSLTPARRAPWRVLTEAPSRQASIGWRMVPGVLLILLAAFLAVGLADRYAGGHAILQGLTLIGVLGGAAILIGSPLLVGSLTRLDRDKAGRAREEERQRFAAHLHDSVLQTLALVQRQAHDPVAVVRLARRQEHALRAWMAGESELASETLSSALREIVAEVEEEYRMTVELTAIGDRPLDNKGEALVAAAREALRNAGRHAPGAPVYMFCEIGRDRAEVFVRDEGPGFLPEDVANERRGIRDAMVGRMAVIGGRATVESAPGEGTEVALLLGPHGGGR